MQTNQFLNASQYLVIVSFRVEFLLIFYYNIFNIISGATYEIKHAENGDFEALYFYTETMKQAFE